MDITRIDEQAARLRQVRELRGFKHAKEAAERHHFVYATYSQHERGQSAITRAAKDYARAFKVSEAWLLTGEGNGPDATNVVRIMGYVGAGAQIEPDFEQVPPEGLGEITAPFDLPEDMLAFGVKGDSMLPVYKNGAVIVVYREQQRPLEAFFGEEAIVRTGDGRRYIKTVMRGSSAGTVNLLSWNAPAIENVRLEWIGEIFAIIPPLALKKVSRAGGLQGQLRLKQA